MEINFDRDCHGRGRTDVELQASISLASGRDDAHDRPVRVAEAACKRLFVRDAGFGRFARMGVNPDTSETTKL